MLYKDILINVRKSLAASIVEVARLVCLSDDLDENDDRTFLVEVANHFLEDATEIKMNIMPNLCDFIRLFPSEYQQVLINTMIRERLVSYRYFYGSDALLTTGKREGEEYSADPCQASSANV